MNNKILNTTKVTVLGALLGIFSACDAKMSKGKKVELTTENQKVSYAIGLDIGKNFKRMEYAINLDNVLRGMKDVMDSTTPAMTDSQIQVVMQAWQQNMMKTQQEKQSKVGETNKKSGEDFLAKNATAEGVKTTASGLQYKVITEGTGKTPTANDTVDCHYRGTLIDGTEFDASRKHGEKPVTFPVGGVIRGWTEALQMMKEGAKYQLFIPSALAYGEQAPPSIGPNSTLIFDIELIAVKSEVKAKTK